MSDLPLFILLVLLVLMSAFFSSAETALINMSKIRLKHLVKENVKNADKLEKLYEDSNKLIGAILIGNNIVNVATSSIATIITTSRFSNAGLGISVGLTTLEKLGIAKFRKYIFVCCAYNTFFGENFYTDTIYTKQYIQPAIITTWSKK